MYKIKTYLVYQLSDQETGTEGWSDRLNFAVIHANTEDDAIQKWHAELNLTNIELIKNNGYWFCYYRVVANEIPTSHYGRVEKLKIIDCWDACIDDANGEYHYEKKEKEY